MAVADPRTGSVVPSGYRCAAVPSTGDHACLQPNLSSLAVDCVYQTILSVTAASFLEMQEC